MSLSSSESLKMWGYHCHHPEAAIITLRSLLKTCENASLSRGIESEDIVSIHYTLAMCSELAEMLEFWLVPLPVETKENPTKAQAAQLK